MVSPVREVNKVVVAATGRSPFHPKNGQLSRFNIVSTCGQVLRETLNRGGLLNDDLHNNLRQVIIGNANGCGTTGTNGAERALIEALGPNAEGMYARKVDSSCGSSADATYLGQALIESGREKYVLTGGMEASVDGQGPAGSDLMYQALSPKAYFANIFHTVFTTMKYGNPERVQQELLKRVLPPDFNFPSMNASGDYIARLMGYDREILERYAATSFARAIDAVSRGFFKNNTVPIDMGEYGYVSQDQIREATSIWAQTQLKPTIRDGFHHAGDSSQFGVGASAVLLANEEVAIADGHIPLSRIIGYGHTSVGLGPGQLLGPLKAIPLALVDAGLLDIKDINNKEKVREACRQIDLWEVNEAYAAEALVVKDEFDIPFDRLNVNGGAIALTHPFAATGTRLIGDVIHEMNRRAAICEITGEKKPRYALVTMCVAQGLSIAIVLERYESKKIEIKSFRASAELPKDMFLPKVPNPFADQPVRITPQIVTEHASA